MENDFVKICEYLTRLAVLKGKIMDEKSIASMGKFLQTDFTAAEIGKACMYLAKRLRGFPDVSDFYSTICPTESIDSIVEREIKELLATVRGGWQNFKSSEPGLSNIKKILLSCWSWSELACMGNSELSKCRTSMSFFLKSKLSADHVFKLSLSEKAIALHKSKRASITEEKNEVEYEKNFISY